MPEVDQAVKDIRARLEQAKRDLLPADYYDLLAAVETQAATLLHQIDFAQPPKRLLNRKPSKIERVEREIKE